MRVGGICRDFVVWGFSSSGCLKEINRNSLSYVWTNIQRRLWPSPCNWTASFTGDMTFRQLTGVRSWVAVQTMIKQVRSAFCSAHEVLEVRRMAHWEWYVPASIPRRSSPQRSKVAAADPRLRPIQEQISLPSLPEVLPFGICEQSAPSRCSCRRNPKWSCRI